MGDDLEKFRCSMSVFAVGGIPALWALPPGVASANIPPYIANMNYGCSAAGLKIGRLSWIISHIAPYKWRQKNQRDLMEEEARGT